MLAVYFDQCSPFAAFLDELSLNEVVSNDPDVGDPLEVINTLPDISIDIEGDLARKEQIDLVRSFVESLPKYYLTIVRRYYWDGESQIDIASSMGVSQQAVSYALAKVARMGREFFGVPIH